MTSKYNRFAKAVGREDKENEISISSSTGIALFTIKTFFLFSPSLKLKTIGHSIFFCSLQKKTTAFMDDLSQ